MPLQIVRNDITKMSVDAIVNAANSSLLGGGGVDGCIHRAAGPKLLAECRTLGGCQTGDAKITNAYDLPCNYVIHAVGPIWRGGQFHERELLTSCYENSLALAKEKHCETIAFPLISSGIYGYPKAQALKVAIDAISAFLMENDMTVYIVIFDKAAYRISSKLFSDIASYIDDHYVETHINKTSEAMRRQKQFREMDLCESISLPEPSNVPLSKAATLEDALQQMDESFSEMLLRKIDESGMTDSQCYKKANIDRIVLSMPHGYSFYEPFKPTVLAFALALELPLPEIQDMLMKAGFALSHSSKFDVIVEYFILKQNYSIYEINEALFAFDQSLIGG